MQDMHLYPEKLETILLPLKEKRLGEIKMLISSLRSRLRPTLPTILKSAYIEISDRFPKILSIKERFLFTIYSSIDFISTLKAIEVFFLKPDMFSDISLYLQKLNETKQLLQTSKQSLNQLFEDDVVASKTFEWLIYASRFLIGAESYLDIAKLRNVSSYRQIVSLFAADHCISLFQDYLAVAREISDEGRKITRKKQALSNIALSLIKQAEAMDLDVLKTPPQTKEKIDTINEIKYILLPSLKNYLENKEYLFAINNAFDVHYKLAFLNEIIKRKSAQEISQETPSKQNYFYNLIIDTRNKGNFDGVLPIYFFESAEFQATSKTHYNLLVTASLYCSDVYFKALEQNILGHEKMTYYG